VVTLGGILRRGGGAAAVLAGLTAAFVVGVSLVRALRPALLFESEPSWAIPRLLLSLGVIGLSVLCGGLAAGGYLLWLRTGSARADLQPLPLSHGSLWLLAAAALAAGTLLRFHALDRIPESLWIDDLSLIRPALSLEGRPGDFADSVRAAPFGVSKPYGSVGVLYLEAYRLSLRAFGTTIFGVRFLSALAGSLSLLTAALLARALLPRGGGTLAALTLAGLRWSLILSRWGWVQIVLAPIADLSSLLALRARRKSSPAAALAAGALAGLGAHVYLAAWIVAAALVVFVAWPQEPPSKGRLRLAGLVLAGFALAAAPLLFLREGRRAPYFSRTGDHNIATEVLRQRSLLPPLAAAADAISGPWLLSDPSPRNDLAGRRRLGWILGLPVSIALCRSLLRPREDLSALLLTQAAAALAACVASGQADSPNGARFAYLTGTTAVAAAAGTLALVGWAPARWRRRAALVAMGLIAIAGAMGARDALAVWPERRETFDGFHGQDTLIGRAAARWDEQGEVFVERGLGHSDISIAAVRGYRLGTAPLRPRGGASTVRSIRVVGPRMAAGAGERIVENVQDGWGRPWAVVLASPGGSP
jgi:hypothetical protein